MDFTDLRFPLTLPASRWRRALKVMLGSVLLLLSPARAQAIQRGELDPPPYRLADELMLTALIHRHQRAGTLDQLAVLHDRFWASEQALSFHAQAETRFRNWWVEHHSRIVPMIERQLAEAPGRYRMLAEIGCGSGLVLDDVAQRLPQIESLVGLDLSAEQIERTRSRHNNPRLSFWAGDAHDWMRDQLPAQSIVFTNAGVLEYFPRAKLESLLASIAARAPVMCALIEPLDPDFDLHGSESRAHGMEHSFSHPYGSYLRAAGFELIEVEEQTLEGQRWVLLLARKS
jgi:SAM-dependent methyltransferase